MSVQNIQHVPGYPAKITGYIALDCFNRIVAMAKQQRIDHFNMWPRAQEFPAESHFRDRVSKFDIADLFFPYQIPQTTNQHVHIVISYLLDAIDSLPYRPDHAFDWAWRAFEYLTNNSSGGIGNITDTIRNFVCPEIDLYFSSNNQAENAFFELVEKIPLQTCEYWIKRIVEAAPYTFSPGNHKVLSSYAKRLLFANGQPPITSPAIHAVLCHLGSNFNLSDTTQRRNGASLLRRIIRAESVLLGSTTVQLSRSEILFFLISGLGYAFRNDRAHAKSIAPFRSSFASVKTYAHCWFMFLLIYEVTFMFLHSKNSPQVFTGCPAPNFINNNHAYAKLFADYLNS